MHKGSTGLAPGKSGDKSANGRSRLAQVSAWLQVQRREDQGENSEFLRYESRKTRMVRTIICLYFFVVEII